MRKWRAGTYKGLHELGSKHCFAGLWRVVGLFCWNKDVGCTHCLKNVSSTNTHDSVWRLEHSSLVRVLPEREGGGGGGGGGRLSESYSTPSISESSRTMRVLVPVPAWHHILRPVWSL